MRPKAPKHGRMKPKHGRAMNAAEKRHAERLVEKIGCVVPQCLCRASIHHEHRHGGYRDHKLLVPLCWTHHQGGGGRHDIGHDAFKERYGVDCEKFAKEQWAISQEMFA